MPDDGLAVEGEVELALLPAAHLAGAEEDGDGLALVRGPAPGPTAMSVPGTRYQRSMKQVRPLVFEPSPDAFDGLVVAGVVAQEDVVGPAGGVHRRHASLATGARGHGLERGEARAHLRQPGG